MDADIVIVGAGALGLAVAAELGQKNREIVVLERHSSFGQETSSRNSEVIHSGIYYPAGSLKARLCVEGRRLLYEFCKVRDIAHRRLGKLIVATNDREAKELDELMLLGENNGVEDLSLLSSGQIKKQEPHIKASSAIQSPSTGILDVHQFMKCLEYLAKDKGVIFAYNCEVSAIEKGAAGFRVEVRDADAEKIVLSTPVLINSAGLCSDRIAGMAGIEVKKAGYKLSYSKGEYFRIKPARSALTKKLIYPTPNADSLGIHTVKDLEGQLKLGPNAFYVEDINYDVEPFHANEFYESARRFLPFIKLGDLSPDTCGIRPKLQGPGEPVRDFVICSEEKRGFPGLVNLIGIESPGLTASLAIARYVSRMLR
ncbi:MAG: NAD(P)/FAD-dependent oxidoreductase [Candidatus Omnitrophica bacterium]|nr:NAD(P)/FAD-dependent oxidoreductase [Candidatus Omnitrophota bacterium]